MDRARPFLGPVAALAFLAAVAPGAAAAEETAIELLYSKLTSDWAREREIAKSRILLAGSPGIAAAFERVDGARPRLKVEILDILARSGDPRGLDRVAAALDDPDPFVARSAGAILLEADRETVDRLVGEALGKEKVESALGRELAQKVLTTHVFETTEAFIRGKVTSGATNIFYTGQFKELADRGAAAANAVLTMYLAGPDYEFLLPVADENERSKLVFLVGRALLDVALVGGDAMAKVLNARFIVLRRDGKAPASDEMKFLRAALYKAGWQEYLNAWIDELRDRRDPQSRHELAHALYDADRHEESIAVYEQIIADEPSDNIARYNKACGYARLGRKAEAFEALRAAWDAGYRNLEAMCEDGDLAILHADPGWKAFVDWAKEQEKK